MFNFDILETVLNISFHENGRMLRVPVIKKEAKWKNKNNKSEYS